MNPFTEHPQQQGISYFAHFAFAIRIAFRLVYGAFMFGLHAVIPAVPVRKELDLQATIEFLHEQNNWIENAGKPRAWNGMNWQKQ